MRPKTSDVFGLLRKTSDFFGRLRTSSGIFGNDRVVFKNPSTPRIKISCLHLRKSWQVYSTSKITIPVRNEQRCCSTAEWLQEALQKSCKSAALQQSQIWAAVENPLTAINSAFAAVQKIPESRSALQSGCKVASKRQRMLWGIKWPTTR